MRGAVAISGFLGLTAQAFGPRHVPTRSSSSSFRIGLYQSMDHGDKDPSDERNGKKNPLEEKRRTLLENATPKLPDNGAPRSKSDIYREEELQNLWDIHQEISRQTEVKQSAEGILETASISSIHDLVMGAVGEVDKKIDSLNGETKDDDGIAHSWWTDEIQQRSRNIRAIASDVDGTLIGSDQLVHPRTKGAIQKAIQASFSPVESLQFFFPATGKTKVGVMESLGPDLAPLLHQCPGVFIQGLYCVYGDEVIFERKLKSNAVEACEKLVAETGTCIIAYDGDTLYTTNLTQLVIDLHEIYKEPLSKEIPSIAGHAPGVHKVLVCDEDTNRLTRDVRPMLEKLAAANNARVTQAIPTMLELLPEGCSKALGVEKLCEVLGIHPGTELLALGDAENDVEMLQMASIGVAVGNGTPHAKEAADIVLDETNDQGGAGLAIEVIGGL